MKSKIAIVMTMAAVSGAALAGPVTLDGVIGGDLYSNSESVTWFNGHKTAESIYGDFGSQFATTTISYGVGELAGDKSGTQYFFLHVAAPLYAKNMIWQTLDWVGSNFPVVNGDPLAGLTEADVASYRTQHETHHSPGTMKLDFKGATGSEKAIFVNSSGASVFTANLGGAADSAFGLINFKDSVDFLLDNGISTKELSLARDTTMSFEFQFALNTALNEELLGYVRNGIEFHLSPERGLEAVVVPLPTAALMGSLGLVGIAVRRRRI